MEDLLDAADLRRSNRLRNHDLRQRFVVGRAALRSILSMLDSGSVAATDWRFGTLGNGKPCIQEPEGLRWSFNLSYAGELIAIVASKDVDVGVDIELHHEIPRNEIPWHLFSNAERRLLRSTAVVDLPPVFLRLWTLKEAIAKRTGQGFATEFSAIDTTVLNVVEDGREEAEYSETDAVLFHEQISIHGETAFVSVSAAPQGSGPIASAG